MALFQRVILSTFRAYKQGPRLCTVEHRAMAALGPFGLSLRLNFSHSRCVDIKKRNNTKKQEGI
jgi:hypothetical protein